MSLRTLEQRTNVSRAAINDYERGLRLPNREFALALDTALQQGGALVGLLGLAEWSPTGPASTTHQWPVPGEWVGSIWVSLVSADGTPPGPVHFRWGVWAADATTESSSPTFTTVATRQLRYESERARVMYLTCAKPCHAYWEKGQPPSELEPVDIGLDWYPYQESEVYRAAGGLLNDVLAYCGRTPRELAEFLDIDVSLVQALLDGRTLAGAPGRPLEAL